MTVSPLLKSSSVSPRPLPVMMAGLSRRGRRRRPALVQTTVELSFPKAWRRWRGGVERGVPEGPRQAAAGAVLRHCARPGIAESTPTRLTAADTALSCCAAPMLSDAMGRCWWTPLPRALDGAAALPAPVRRAPDGRISYPGERSNHNSAALARCTGAPRFTAPSIPICGGGVSGDRRSFSTKPTAFRPHRQPCNGGRWLKERATRRRRSPPRDQTGAAGQARPPDGAARLPYLRRRAEGATVVALSTAAAIGASCRGCCRTDAGAAGTACCSPPQGTRAQRPAAGPCRTGARTRKSRTGRRDPRTGCGWSPLPDGANTVRMTSGAPGRGHRGR